jgi:murein DD-endopeptidase MepM/ murein hydrolase activator NlpD
VNLEDSPPPINLGYPEHGFGSIYSQVFFRFSPLRFSQHPYRFRLTAFLIGLGCFLVLAFPPFRQIQAVEAQQPAATPSMKDLEQWRKTLNEYRSGIKQQRQQIQNLEQAARDRLGGLNQNVNMTAAQIQQAELTLEQATLALKELDDDLVQSNKNYQQRLQVTVARLQFLQRQRPGNTWAILLASQDLGQFISRRRELQQIYASDQALLVNLKSQSDRLKVQQQQIQLQSVQIAELRQQLLRQKANYANQAQAQAQLVNRLSQDRQAMMAAEDQLQRDSQNVTLLIRQRLGYLPGASGQETFIYGTGRLSYPSQGPVTSNFGWRNHPVLGYSRFHAGTDFGVPTGTPIRAADSGRVIFAGWQGGYGNTVILDHGGGMTTLYGHASQLYVQEGQRVERGQTIAAVGSTGLSTGPHLHFEVRVNGDPKNPLNYL